MMSNALLIILVAGTVGVLIACGRAISAARFGRSLRAARLSPPTERDDLGLVSEIGHEHRG